jgi:ubiquinone/menaquinone biosynthesis C-methylase UbiE
MFSKILPYMCCPVCSAAGLIQVTAGLSCYKCHVLYPFKNGILDMIKDNSREVITPFQRLMQTPAIVSIYEKIWRRIGYYVASSRSFRREMETVLRIAKDRKGVRLLDLACGPGVFTRPLAHDNSGVVIGLDLSWPMLNHAQQVIKKEGIRNVLFIRASAFSLPFIDSSFSYVNCCGALHLFDKPDAALKEIGRILSSDGCLGVQTTIRPERSAGIAFILERFIRFGFFNEAELCEKLQIHGFKIEESERHRISFTFLARKSSMVTHQITASV